MMSKSDGDPSASETSMMENYQNFYEQAINQCESKIRQLMDAKSEYTSVLKSLSELGASTSTSLSVPISNIAYFSAVPETSRKDQVLLLLGDKWFVETDSKHACQIASRRLEHVNSSLSALERDLATLKQQNAELRALKNTESTGDQHQSEKSDESTKNDTDQPSAPKNVSEAEFARLMQRLDELERMEDDEQLDSDDSLEPAESVSDQNQELHNTKQPIADNELKRKTSDGSNKRVRFDSDQNETRCYDKAQTTLEQSGTENGDPDKATSSASNDPAPILRNKGEKSPVNADAPLLADDEPPKPRPIIEMSPSMFTGEVVERNVTETNYTITGVGDRTAPPKRVSLFQQRRL